MIEKYEMYRCTLCSHSWPMKGNRVPEACPACNDGKWNGKWFSEIADPTESAGGAAVIRERRAGRVE